MITQRQQLLRWHQQFQLEGQAMFKCYTNTRKTNLHDFSYTIQQYNRIMFMLCDGHTVTCESIAIFRILSYLAVLFRLKVLLRAVCEDNLFMVRAKGESPAKLYESRRIPKTTVIFPENTGYTLALTRRIQPCNKTDNNISSKIRTMLHGSSGKIRVLTPN